MSLARPVSGLLLFAAVVAWACETKEVTFKELTAYITDPENGLRLKEEAGGILMEVQYRPTDMWVRQELGEDSPDTATINRLRAKYSRYDYYILSLSREGKEALTPSMGMGGYSELVQVLSFRMGQYITMTTSAQDTILVSDTNLNRTYGLGTSTDLLVVFSREKIRKTEWVQFNLNEFGLGTGNQRFRFKTTDLRSCPNINFLTSH